MKDLIALCCLLLPAVFAFPNGAPNCPIDSSAPGPSHRFEGYKEQNLARGGVQVFLNGCELEKNSTLTVGVFEPLTVTIRSSVPFRGVLARFDTDQAIGLFKKEKDLQISEACATAEEPTMGVTHTHRKPKTEVSFKVVFMEQVNRIRLAVDVVKRNSADANKSVFYHGKFRVQSRYDNKGKQCLNRTKAPKVNV